MFGIANQLLAVIALAVGTTVLINAGRARYAWVTLVPLTFVAITTLTAGWLSVRDNFCPMAIGPVPALHFQGWLNTVFTVDDDGLRGRDPGGCHPALDLGRKDGHRPGFCRAVTRMTAWPAGTRRASPLV